MERVAAESLGNVTLADDDLFDSRLPERGYDLVHARFQLAPLGRPAEQLAAYRRLLAPGGLLVLEDPDTTTWSFSPVRRTLELIELVLAAFRAAGGDFNAGRESSCRPATPTSSCPGFLPTVAPSPPGHSAPG